MLQIDHEQDDHRGAEHRPDREQPLGAERGVGGDEDARRQQLDERVHDADRFAARPASTEEHRPAQDGDVLVPGLICAPARGAARRGPDHRQVARQPIDAHVEEAADDEADERDEEIIHAHCTRGGWVDLRADRQRVKGRAGASVTAPLVASSAYGTPPGSSGAPTACGRGRARPRTPGTRPFWPCSGRHGRQLVDGVERVELRQPKRRRCCEATRCRPTRGAIARARASCGGRRPARASRPPATAATRARPECRRPSGTTSRRCGSRPATSSGRTRCPAGSATRRVRPEPLLEERNRLVGAPGPARIAFREKDRAEPVRDDEPGVERRGDVEQRVQPGRSSGPTMPSAACRRSTARRGSSRCRRRAA